MSNGTSLQIHSVQALRAIAALMVVFGHSQGTAYRAAIQAGAEFDLVRLPWGGGVDLFFLISGFIMLYASDGLFGRSDAPATFMSRRIVRVVPLYWACTTAFLAVLVLKAATRGADLPDAGAIAASYLFIPYDTFGNADGFAFPLYDLGWTLNYEFLFYAIFACFIWLPRERAALASALAIAALIVLGLALSPSAVALRFWTAPIMTEFVAGIGIAIARRNGVTLPTAGRIGLILTGFALLMSDYLGLVGAQGTTTPNDFSRVFGWGLPAAMILAGAVLGPDRPLDAVSRWPARLGSRLSPFALLALCVVGSTAVSLVVFRFFEKPVTQSLRNVGRPGFVRVQRERA
jgi:peptidoglycan/LPS O-acetylase OafA/YrhL